MTSKVIISDDSYGRDLTSRERDILRSIIHLYILKAAPIGSRHLAKYLEKEMKLSPATIRNVMSDLEEMQFIHIRLPEESRPTKAIAFMLIH